MRKKLSFKDVQQRFIEQSRIDIKLCEDEFYGWKKKCKFFDIIQNDYFWAVPNNVYINKTKHPKRRKKVLLYKEVIQKFINQGRDDIILCEDEFNGYKQKSKFYDLVEQDYFWTIPYNVFKKNSSHPKRGRKIGAAKKSIDFKKAKEKFKYRDDIKLIEYNGWKFKSKFFDIIQNDYFWSKPDSVYYRNSCHPLRAKINCSKTQILSLTEAKQRLAEQKREDIELIEESYNGWKNKCKFFDKIEGKHFISTPYYVYTRKNCHPKRSRKNNAIKISISFTEACQRFIDQGRTDIEICKEEYNGWNKKCLFWDNIQKDYFYMSPCKVFLRNSRHPKRAASNRSIKMTILKAKQRYTNKKIEITHEIIEKEYEYWKNRSNFSKDVQKDHFISIANDIMFNEVIKKEVTYKELSFEEAAEKFKTRIDVSLIEDYYKGWCEKSKFYDIVDKSYFWAVPRIVFYNKQRPPKRKHVSNSQLEIFTKLSNIFSSNVVLLEKRIVVENKLYFADVLFPQYKIIVEYNGDYWHCNPKLYNKNYFNAKKQKTAKELWAEDRQRKEDLEKIGYKILVIWENDYKKDKEKIIKNLVGSIKTITNNNQKNFVHKINFKEAEQRFILQGRDDIILCEDEFHGWKNKSKFYDKIQEDYFWARPYNVYIKKLNHPKLSFKKKSEAKTISFLEAQQRFIEQGRTDIELVEDEYKSWAQKTKFYDKIQEDYFWSRPCDVYKRKSCHPKRSVSIRIKNTTLSFEEARERFKERNDIELIEDGFNGWRFKSKFYDKIQKDYFWSRPYAVDFKKSCHPKRRKISKNQLKLLEDLRNSYKEYEILSEQKNIINNKNYAPDILFPQYKIIIEYNGDYWHCNPNLYNENFFHPEKKVLAKDVWKYDKQRKEELEKNGYKVLVVWEYDYKNNKEETFKKLKKHIDLLLNK